MGQDQSIEELNEFFPTATGMVYALDASRKITTDNPDDSPIYCFICSQLDSRKTPVAYDDDADGFVHCSAEPHDSQVVWYLNTKEFIYQILLQDDAVSDIRKGADLSSPETRAPLYARTRQGRTVAFEITGQIGRKLRPVKSLHKGYQSKNIHGQWIYCPDNPNPFFSYDYRHGLVADASLNRIGFIVIKADPTGGAFLGNSMFPSRSDVDLAHSVKYVRWTDARDWTLTDDGLAPKPGSAAEDTIRVCTAKRRIVEKEKESQSAEWAETLAQHKEKAIARAKKRGIDPDKGDEVFIPPLEEPPYTSYPLTQGMLIEQAAYMAHMSPFDYIKDVLDSSRQWDAYTALRNRWESTGKYDSSTFPDFDLLRKRKQQ